MVLAPQSDGADRAFDGVVVDVSLPNISSSPNSAIAPVQPAQSRLTDNASPPLDGPAERRLLAQGEMSAVAIVIGHISRHQAPQMFSAKDNNVIEAFAPDRADQPLDMPVLPGRCRLCRAIVQPQAADAIAKRGGKQRVVIAHQDDAAAIARDNLRGHTLTAVAPLIFRRRSPECVSPPKVFRCRRGACMSPPPPIHTSAP